METTISQDRETNIKLVSGGYAAFGRGDMETLAQLFHTDMVWHALRLGELSGDKVGRDAVFAFFAKTMELTQGTFSVTPDELIASDTTVSVVCRSRARRNGRELDDQQVHLFHLRDGQVVEVWQYTGPTADDFWA
jgi:ketosteroid isomerase-like protein